MALSKSTWTKTGDSFTLTVPNANHTKDLFGSGQPVVLILRPVTQELWNTVSAAAGATSPELKVGPNGTLQGDVITSVVRREGEYAGVLVPALQRVREEGRHSEQQEAVAHPLLLENKSELTQTKVRVRDLERDVALEIRARRQDKEQLTAMTSTVLNMGQVVSVDHPAALKTCLEKVSDLRGDVYKGKSDVDKCFAAQGQRLAEQNVEIDRLRRVIDRHAVNIALQHQRLSAVEKEPRVEGFEVGEPRNEVADLRHEIDTLKEIWGKMAGQRKSRKMSA